MLRPLRISTEPHSHLLGADDEEQGQAVSAAHNGVSQRRRTGVGHGRGRGILEGGELGPGEGVEGFEEFGSCRV